MTILLILLISSCGQNTDELRSELEEANKKIKELEEKSGNEGMWYVFEPTVEYNVVKLKSSNNEIIESMKMKDSVDINYVFDHTATISQIRDNQLSSLFLNFKEYSELTHEARGFGPNVENTSYHVKVFVICEEDPLPIETENCTDNIYILIQPTELGYESNLFRLSRLFDTKIQSINDTDGGIILELVHSRFPRKIQRVLLRPELVKFLD